MAQLTETYEMRKYRITILTERGVPLMIFDAHFGDKDDARTMGDYLKRAYATEPTRIDVELV